MKNVSRTWRRCLLCACMGSGLFLTGCDATLKRNAEDGIINASSALLGSTLQALITVASEAAAAR